MSSEKIKCLISTKIKGADSPEKILKSISNIFPEVDIENDELLEPSFPNKVEEYLITLECNKIDEFIDKISKQRILDTALDAMSHNLHDTSTWFQISRQAALANKVAFNLRNEYPLGGKFKIVLTKSDLPIWLENITWHSGREEIPRFIGDDYSMKKDGLSREWFSNN